MSESPIRDRFREISRYHESARLMVVEAGLRPEDRSLQKRLADLHRRAGFPALADAAGQSSQEGGR